jgi:hypothetical protein
LWRLVSCSVLVWRTRTVADTVPSQ